MHLLTVRSKALHSRQALTSFAEWLIAGAQVTNVASFMVEEQMKLFSILPKAASMLHSVVILAISRASRTPGRSCSGSAGQVLDINQEMNKDA